MTMRLALVALIMLTLYVVNVNLGTENASAQSNTSDEQVKSLTNQINFSSISLPNHDKGTTKENSQSIPDLLIVDNDSAMISHSLPSYWTDPYNECVNRYKCAINYTSGWKDNTSLQISTTNNSEHNWSNIFGKPIVVNRDEQYVFTTHEKLNKYAVGTHILLEGYNQTWGQWYQLAQCPSGLINGPLNWSAFSCGITIPEKIAKIRPVMNAGWSSQRDQEAVSMFDAFSLEKKFNSDIRGPVVSDPNLRIKIVAEGLQSPTAMAFLGPNDFLVAEQNLGTIKRIVNDTILPQPLLQVNVGSEPDWGLLGLAVQNRNSTNNKLTYVFVYYTETERAGADHGKALGNRLYRYQLSEDGSKLINPKLLLDLPGEDVSYHNGGAILIGPDSNLYVPIGDVDIHYTEAENYKDSSADGTGGILRVTQDGKPVVKGILGDTYPLNLYYAYGIRNSYGIDFDPISGKLWDTENGPEFGDELNLVEPGFNSGWAVVQGTTVMASHGSRESVNFTFPTSLVNFEGKGTYSGPELTWNFTVGPTALKFLKSEALGKQYENDMFVGSVAGDIFHFNLNKNRDALSLRGLLADNLSNNVDETQRLVWARNFNLITDIEVGPDGYLYVVSNTDGKIYKIFTED